MNGLIRRLFFNPNPCMDRRRSSTMTFLHGRIPRWKGVPLEDLIIYELHIGAFSPEGTFDGAVARIDSLLELGVTAIEIMPVAQFPGSSQLGV